jgi:hypothetical protein
VDPRKFDGLIRQISETLSRRAFVGGSLGATALAAAGLSEYSLAKNDKKHKKKKKKKKQTICHCASNDPNTCSTIRISKKAVKQHLQHHCDYEGDCRPGVAGRCTPPVAGCVRDNQCGGATPFCQNQRCVQCRDTDGCPAGQVCQQGTCACPNGRCVVTVTPNALNGWQFFLEVGANPPDPIDPTMEVGPEIPPEGIGSALLEISGDPPDNTGKLLAAAIFKGTPLSDFAVLEYSVYVTNALNGTAPSLQLGIDLDLNDTDEGFQGRLVFVPSATSPITPGDWVTLDTLTNAGTGNWFLTPAAGVAQCPLANPCTFSEVLGFFPNIGIHRGDFGFIGFKVGSGEGPVDANVDALEIKLDGAGASTTVYDFEPAP